MTFTFQKKAPQVTSVQIRQIKKWIYEIFDIEPDISISLSQLQCKEQGCPPVETVISIMTNPIQQYKVHRSIQDIKYMDIYALR
ncbi:MAG: hypothetical protein ACFB02_16555 [Mastigocoleus sp.]